MSTVYFVMDESGAKGYAKNKEAIPGELGVMAGYFVPGELLDLIRSELESIRSRFLEGGKLHITDLSAEKQEELRAHIFYYFSIRKMFWTYEAMYVEGLHQYASAEAQRHENIMKQRRSPILLSGNQKQMLLHAELFQGVFGKGVAFCHDMVGKEFAIKVITDRVDNSLLEVFNRKAYELLNVGSKREFKVTGFDPEAKKVIKRSFTMETNFIAGVIEDYSGIEFSISCEDSSLTLAADVLANSVHYHLKSKQKDNVGCSLNAVDAIAGHPLDGIVFGAWPESDTNYISDAIFMHPKNEMK